jgi:methionyl-tRNA formyltransferase
MKILLMADGDVGYSILKFLIANHIHDLALVLTTEENSIYGMAKDNNIEAYVYESTMDFLVDKIENIDLGFLVWWPKIIRNPLLSLPKLGFINTHPSYLPYNRGKNYNFWALKESTPFGVTLHLVDDGIDTGAIIAQREIHYDWTDTGETLYLKAKKEMVNLFNNSYPKIRAGSFPTKSQDSENASYHHSKDLEIASQINLDESYSGRELINLMRARTFRGHPGSWFIEDGIKYEVFIEIRKV